MHDICRDSCLQHTSRIRVRPKKFLPCSFSNLRQGQTNQIYKDKLYQPKEWCSFSSCRFCIFWLKFLYIYIYVCFFSHLKLDGFFPILCFEYFSFVGGRAEYKAWALLRCHCHCLPSGDSCHVVLGRTQSLWSKALLLLLHL